MLFVSYFKLYANKSPKEYLVDYRLERAAEHISQHNISITEATISCGYQDLYSFFYQFK